MIGTEGGYITPDNRHYESPGDSHSLIIACLEGQAQAILADIEILREISSWGSAIGVVMYPLKTRLANVVLIIVESGSLHHTWHDEVMPEMTEFFSKKYPDVQIRFELEDNENNIQAANKVLAGQSPYLVGTKIRITYIADGGAYGGDFQLVGLTGALVQPFERFEAQYVGVKLDPSPELDTLDFAGVATKGVCNLSATDRFEVCG